MLILSDRGWGGAINVGNGVSLIGEDAARREQTREAQLHRQSAAMLVLPQRPSADLSMMVC